MYQETLKKFKDVENLGGKAWQHAYTIDFLDNNPIKDCSLHCFHYQQMFDCLFKHILETKSELGFYSRSHKLNKLLEQIISVTAFRTDKTKYHKDLFNITVCAEEYRYNYEIDCKEYFGMVAVCDELLIELVEFENSPYLNS